MTIKIGGRGNKAPYETRTVRVPLAVYSLVEKLNDEYRSKITNSPGDLNSHLYSVKNLEQAIQECEKILKARKSAKQSLQKLLQVLYEVNDTNLIK